MTNDTQPLALITGASRGLGFELARALQARGWRLVLTARDVTGLADKFPGARVVAGDVTDAAHRSALVAGIERLDLLVNNASALGPSPMPTLAEYPVDALRTVYETNAVAPIALIGLLASALRAADGTVVDVSSDAAVEPYTGWGGYGSAKAALDHATAVLAVEEPGLRVYAVDPGDMRTAMHQAAFPGEDISDRPEPGSVVPHLISLLDAPPPSGRYRAADLPIAAQAPVAAR